VISPSDRALRDPHAEGHDGAEELWKASLGGALIATPLVVADWLGTPSWLFVPWLITATAVLGWLLIRERQRANPPDAPI
jgi:hypothetical protein